MSRKEKTKKEQVADLISEVVSQVWNYPNVKTFEDLIALDTRIDRALGRISILMLDEIEPEMHLEEIEKEDEDDR